MARILILFAHPALEKSRVHLQLIRQLPALQDITFHDLYELYPDFEIEVKKEQQLLLAHDVIVWQHPFYWYSAPAIIKQWEDLVLEHGWAYGTTGHQLAGKSIFNILTCGGPKEAYSPNGRNRFSIRDFLLPFHQTALTCRMNYWPPFVIHGTHRLQAADINAYAQQYRQLLLDLADDKLQHRDFEKVSYLNDFFTVRQKQQL